MNDTHGSHGLKVQNKKFKSSNFYPNMEYNEFMIL